MVDCFESLCAKLLTVGALENNDRLEFGRDGSVAIVQQGLGLWNRKLINVSAQSRKKTIDGLRELIDLANDLSSGIMRLPKIRTDKTTVGETDDSNSLCVEANVDTNNESAPEFLNQCQERDGARLQRLADCLRRMCRGMNRLATSTYSSDTDTCGTLMSLVGYAQLIVERVDKQQQRQQQQQQQPGRAGDKR